MWIEERKTGYVFVEKYKDPMTGKWKTVSTTRASKSRASQNAARRALGDRIDKIMAQAGIIKDGTVGEAIDAYLKDKEHVCKAQTLVGYRASFNVIRNRLDENALMENLTAPYCRDKLMDTPGTYNERIKKFKSFIRWSYQNNYLHDIGWLDKLTKATEPSTREKNSEKYLDHGEIEAVLAGFTIERYRLLAEFLILSGLRIGEAIALDVADITDVIKVDKTYSIKIGRISTTKTETSEREVFIQDELADCIRRIKRWRLEDMMARGYKTSHLIPSRNGNYLSGPCFNTELKRVTAKTIGRQLTAHALRHTHVAMLAEAGLTLDEIARRVGHSDSKVTREVYFHVTKKMREKDNQRIKSVRII